MIQTLFLVLALAGSSLQPDATGRPVLTHVGMIAPDVIAITIRAQSVEPGEQVAYEPQPGDGVVAWQQHRYVRRGADRIGALGGSEGRIIQTPDRLLGEPLDTEAADQVDT